MNRLAFVCICLIFSFVNSTGHSQELKTPRAVDDRLTVELFAEHPQIVTPTGITVDKKGRVFVAESHTHFRPDDYDGPKADRILIFEDTDNDGRADKRHVFHEGFTHVMDIEMHHDGSLYVATRMNIHRMRDTDGDNKADEITPIVKMKTTGTYPHNGLSGIAFEFDGSFHFGLGENLGHDYTLSGMDGTKISGGGEGGSTYHVQADGSKLRRTSTGWWNPFGMCVDAFGRVFGTDNDPGASPPCRLIQVFEGGDYGYEYRYGRTGLHPLITWTGDMRGTIPMIAGTGEAPCAIIAYESDAFPKEYLGQLLVASWADHRIERYPITQPKDRSLVKTSRQAFIEGGDDFRPVGLAIAPDGSVFVSDWVSSSYALHKKGRIWRIKPKRAVSRKNDNPLDSIDRQIREGELRTFLKGGEGAFRTILKRSQVARTRATTIDAAAQAKDTSIQIVDLVLQESSIDVQHTMLRHQVARTQVVEQEKQEQLPGAFQHFAARETKFQWPDDLRHPALRHHDPVIFSAAVDSLAVGLDPGLKKTFIAENPVAAILALKRNPATRERLANSGLEAYLDCKDGAARFHAVKWIADDQLKNYRPALVQMLNDPQSQLDVPMFLAVSAAIDRVDGKKPSDVPSAERLIKVINDDDAPVNIRRIALRLIDPTFKGLNVKMLAELTTNTNPQFRLEATRTLARHPSPERIIPLAQLAAEVQSPAIQAAAVRGMAVQDYAGLLVEIVVQAKGPAQREALRSLSGLKLDKEEILSLRALDGKHVESVKRVVTQMPFKRPAATDIDGWMKLLDDSGDANEGERIFFGASVGTCSKCHQFEGRGQAVGPPLTFVSRRLAEENRLDNDRAKRWLLETILQPSKQMAPQYTPWQIVTKDGKVLTGLPRRKGGSREAYLGLNGKEFTVNKADIEFHQEMKTSIMAKGLLNHLTVQELNDLFAFLMAN